MACVTPRGPMMPRTDVGSQELTSQAALMVDPPPPPGTAAGGSQEPPLKGRLGHSFLNLSFASMRLTSC